MTYISGTAVMMDCFELVQIIVPQAICKTQTVWKGESHKVRRVALYTLFDAADSWWYDEKRCKENSTLVFFSLRFLIEKKYVEWR